MRLITLGFPFWAIVMSGLAWWQAAWFIPLKAAILPLLALIMFLMGLTLRLEDFQRVLLRPQLILLGVVLQFGLMPLLAWLIAQGLALETMLATGLILVGCCSGGTASNVITYLAGGDVALSISLTAMSTLLGVIFTPWLSWLYIDAEVVVPVWAMLQMILLLVIIPVAAGLATNQLLPRLVKPLQPLCPVLAVLAIVLIIAIVVALNADRMAILSLSLLLAVMLHNLAGLSLGYLISRTLGYSSVTARTLAIEVGMQNSGLAVALALKNFAALAALPGAVFSIWHNISGSLLAAYWQWRSRGERESGD